MRENQVDGGVLGADSGSGRALTEEELKSRVSRWAGSGVGASTLSRYAATSTVENALRGVGREAQGQGMGGVQDVEAVRAIRSALGEVPVAKDSGLRRLYHPRLSSWRGMKYEASG